MSPHLIRDGRPLRALPRTMTALVAAVVALFAVSAAAYAHIDVSADNPVPPTSR